MRRYAGAARDCAASCFGPRAADVEALGQYFVHQGRRHEALLQDGKERGVHLAEHALALGDGFAEHGVAEGGDGSLSPAPKSADSEP